MNELAVSSQPSTPTASITLYQACEELQAWTDTLELRQAELTEVEDEETRVQLRADILDIEQEIGKWIRSAGAKVDRFNAYLSHLEQQAKFCRSEELRIGAFRRALEASAEQLEQYAVAALEYASVKRITGNSSFIALRRCPDSVKELDTQKIPEEYFRRTFTIDGESWMEWFDLLEETLDMQQHGTIYQAFYRLFRVKEIELERAKVKKAIKDGVEVEGATLKMGQHSLQRG